MPVVSPQWQPKFNPWLIGVVVAMAAFMEVLDTSIANVALPYIGGNLGASTDQSTWILTSYLVSNAVVLPISGWLASELTVKIVRHVMKNRLRPSTLANHPLMGSTTAFDTR